MTTATAESMIAITDGLQLHVPASIRLSDDQFFEFCQANTDLRIERSAQGDLRVMAPAGGESGGRNFSIAVQLGVWAQADGTGVGFDSSTGFVLPNGATRSPDASWVRRDRLASLTPEQKRRFLPLCPDFAIELRSASDSLSILQDKMTEYVDNGLRLGWLIDPVGGNRIYVYRPGVAVQELIDPRTVSADPEMPGFLLTLADIWKPF